MRLYLCAQCRQGLLLELKPVEPKGAPKKEKCQLCGRTAYGDLYEVIESRKEKSNGL